MAIRDLQLQSGDTGAQFNVTETPIQRFNQALYQMLQQQQQLGTRPFQEQAISGQEEQVRRLGQTSANLIGASPGIQSAARGAQVSAVQPTVSAAQQSQQTFGEQIKSLGDVLQTTRAFLVDEENRQQQTKNNARQHIMDALAIGGSGGLKSLLQTEEGKKAFKLSGFDEETIIASAVAREAEDRRRFQVKEGGGVGTGTGVIPGVNPATGQKYKFDTLEDIASLPVGELTKSVIAGYGRVKDLSPTDKATVQTELYKVGFNPYEYVNKKLNNLVTQWGNVPDNFKGIVQGRLQPLAAARNPQVAEFESQKQVLTREIARLFDVGVLSDQDVAAYRSAMPGRGDANLEVVKSKVSGLKTTLGGSLTTSQQGGAIRVRRKSDGKTGRIPSSEFDANLYIKIE